MRRTIVTLLTALLGLGLVAPALAATALTWTSRAAPADQAWVSVTYGNGTYVAVAQGASASTGGRVMTSSDGFTWTQRNSADDTIGWRSVTFGGGQFVAVGFRANDTDGRIMTSTDGITWTVQTSANSDVRWNVVTYANGRYVVAGRSSSTNVNAPRVITSMDGTNWQVSNDSDTANGQWYGLAHGNGLFVAVGNNNAIMTSADNGISWDPATGPGSTSSNSWRSLAYGNGVFVAVAQSGGNRVMTSVDGTAWTPRSSADDTNAWYAVTYGDDLFVAVAQGGTNRVMTSTDGLTWTSQVGAPDTSTWQSVTYGGGQFVAVASSGFPNQVMTTGSLPLSVPWTLVRQALPMPSGGSCADVQDADYAWGTALRGGWQRAWEPWVVNADDSRGGWACLRVLVNKGANDWAIDNSVA